MKLKHILCLAVLLASGCISSSQIAEKKEELETVDGKYLIAPLSGARIVRTHIHTSKHIKKQDIINPSQKLGAIPPWPNMLSRDHDAEIRLAIEEYNKEEYKNAVAILREIYESEKGNLFFIYAFAKALFRFEKYYEESYELFQTLREQLDRENSIAENEILIDHWFPDLYWKLAIFYLDMKEYEKAAFEIARSISCDYDIESERFEHALGYLTECYYYLDNREFNNYLYRATKRLFPSNEYVEPFLLQ